MTATLHPYWRMLGRTGYEVSPLGLGTVKLGRNQGVKYPAQFRIPDDRAAGDLLAQARDLGINLLDTAPAYGNSEIRLGSLLQGQRQDWIIVSKVGEEFDAGVSHFDFSARHTRLSVERSLQRLQTEHIELVLVHSDGNDRQILEQTEVYPTLERLKAEGKIGAFGFSGKTPAGNIQSLQAGDCAMVTFNLNERQELQTIEQARLHNKGILIKKALASGHACLLPGEDPVRKSFELLFGTDGIHAAIIGTIDPHHLSENVSHAVSVLSRSRDGR